MQQAGEVVRRTPESERSNLFEKYIQFAFDNQEGEIGCNVYSKTALSLHGKTTSTTRSSLTESSQQMTETEVKKKIY